MEHAEIRTMYEEINHLPTEILKMIIHMLPPAILVLLQNSSCERINHFSREIKYAIFEDTPSMSLYDIKNYIDVRAAYITILNLNNFNHNPQSASAICESIIHCINLRVLSVKNCYLNDRHICEIFVQLDFIEEFAWNVLSCRSSKTMLIPQKQCLLKKLSLDIADKIDFAFVYNFFLKSCPLLEEINMKLGEISPALKKHFYDRKLDLPNFCSFTATIYPCRHPACDTSCSFATTYSLLAFFARSKPPTLNWKKFWIDIDLPIDFDEFQFSSIDSTVSAVSCPGDVTYIFNKELLYPSSVKAVRLCVLQDLYFEQIYWLKRCGNIHLKVLSIEGNYKNRWGYASCKGDKLATFEDVYGLFEICNNITVLHLPGLHFEFPILRALSQLKGLKHLCLDTCAFIKNHLKTSISSKGKTEHAHDITISEFISCCPLVVEFTLHGCKNMGVVKDEDLVVLHHWSLLQSLSLNYLPLLQTCSFLVPIAIHCMHFKSLELIHVGRNFPVPAVVNMLQRTRSLTHLGIQHRHLLLHKLFIDHNMANATLETVCFFSSSPLSHEAALVIATSFRSLTNLRAVHLMYDKKHPLAACAIRVFKNVLAHHPVQIETVEISPGIPCPCRVCSFNKKNMKDSVMTM